MRACAASLVLLALNAGCGAFSKPPKHALTGAVLTVAYAMAATDKLCADRSESLYASGSKDEAVKLAERCSSAYKAVRSSLVLAAEQASQGGERDASCTAQKAVEAMRDIVRLLDASKRPEVQDGLSAALWLVDVYGRCER